MVKEDKSAVELDEDLEPTDLHPGDLYILRYESIRGLLEERTVELV
jgi:hypothetical protein